MKLEYSKNGDYFLPEIAILGQPQTPLGKYGRMRKTHLQEHRPALYSHLLLSEKLYPHLLEVDRATNERLELLMPPMIKAAGIGEQLKATDQMISVLRITGQKSGIPTTNSRHNHPVLPNLLMRNFIFAQPNRAWVGDITYIPTGEGWLYFAAVKDLCTRKIVSYAFSERINTELTLAALNMAIRCEKPADGLIFHSDRGSQYAATSCTLSRIDGQQKM